MALNIQEREVFGLGLIHLPMEGWKAPETNVLFELDENSEEIRRISGNSYIKKVMVTESGSIQVDVKIRTNPLDNDWPSLHFYDDETITLTEKQIDEFFKPGCLLGKKKEFRRLP